MGVEDLLYDAVTAPQIPENHDYLRWMNKLPIIIGKKEYPQHFAGESHPLLADNWILRRLKGIAQTGQTKWVFAGSHHTREVHTLDGAGVTSLELRYLSKDNTELRELWNEIIAHEIFHDGGTWPYSHMIENLATAHGEADHKTKGVEILDIKGPDGKIMSEELAKYGINVEIVKALLQGKHPAASIVADKNLGAEKIAYLIRDREQYPAYSRLPPPDDIIGLLRYRDGTVGLQSPFVSSMQRHATAYDTHQLGIDIITFYVKQYATLYFSPQSLLAGRHLQRMTEALVNNGLTFEKLWWMSDHELDGAARDSNGEAALEYSRLAHDKLMQPRICYRMQGSRKQFDSEKIVLVEEETANNMGRQFADPNAVSEAEKTLSAICNTPIVLVAWPELRRFAIKPIIYFDGSSRYSLDEAVPNFDSPAKQLITHNWNVRVHANQEIPENKIQEINEYLLRT